MDQATTLMQLLHRDICFSRSSRVLEVGCGTGAQTLILAKNNPDVQIVSIDKSLTSLNQAKALMDAEGITNVDFRHDDIYQLTSKNGLFDDVFVCFVLEHLPDPAGALRHLRSLLTATGNIIAIEGDHGSFYCHPESEAAQKAVACLVELQSRAGGDALIGRKLYPLLAEAGYTRIQVSPQLVYVDAARPKWVEGFSRRTFIAMVAGVKAQALASHLIDEETWEKGMADLYRATEPDGTFCYTFFKAVASVTNSR